MPHEPERQEKKLQQKSSRRAAAGMQQELQQNMLQTSVDEGIAKSLKCVQRLEGVPSFGDVASQHQLSEAQALS